MQGHHKEGDAWVPDHPEMGTITHFFCKEDKHFSLEYSPVCPYWMLFDETGLLSEELFSTIEEAVASA